MWADNWMAVYVDGELIGEDSVPITTERSFNAETFTFDAAYPFTSGIEAKDFMETSSGIEYIGQNNQQMGDGGLIAHLEIDTPADWSTGDFDDSGWNNATEWSAADVDPRTATTGSLGTPRPS